MLLTILLLIGAFLTFFPGAAQAAIASDGLCPLFSFAPFTVGNQSTTPLSTGNYNLTNQGFSHMSAALMAMDHFNNRNNTVVPELKTLTSGCNIRFDTNLSRFFDTGTVEHYASKDVWRNDIEPCAIAGPFNDIPAIDLSVVALSVEIPIVVPRAYNARITSGDLSPFSTQLFPDIKASAINLVDYLLYKNRTDYIGVLYSLTETGIQRREAIAIELNDKKMEWTSSAYDISNDANNTMEEDNPFVVAMKRIQKSGYRTIVVAMEFPWYELPRLSDAAEYLGMNNGDYFWIWYGVFESSLVLSENTIKLLSGSALLIPFAPGYLTDTPFVKAYKTQGKNEVARLNAANPIETNETGYVEATDDWFQNVSVEYASDFMYDAVMAAGIGACLAVQTSNGTLTGESHKDGVRKVVFTGATGRVAFGGGGSPDEVGARDPATVLWTEFNLLRPRSEGNATDYFIITSLFEPATQSWTPTNETFVYRDGTLTAPLLRDQPNQNYLSNGLRGLGLALMSVCLLLSLMCAVWVFMRRKHKVLKASQPPFLYLICFGAAIEASAILTISFDESYGWSKESLSKACMATPWLLPTGQIIIQSSLFTKLWRVNKVLQFARRQVTIRHVAGPMIVKVLLALFLLSLWTGLDPLRWTRVTINVITGESIGQCACDHFPAYMIPLVFLMIIPTALTAFMAWKTVDVDEAYVESKWIFAMILVQLEVAIVAVPVIFILRDVTTNGRYLGYMLLLWVFPMSTLLLIFWPKYVSYRRAVRGVDTSVQPVRGQRQGVVVSGIPSGYSNGKKPTASSNAVEENCNVSHGDSPVLERSVETKEATNP